MPGTVSFMQQSFPGKPNFSEHDIPDLENKVIIVTGSNTGVGKEIARMVYARNAKVYMMARSEDKTRKAMDDIKTAVPESRGQMIYIHLDLADLAGIKTTAREFLTRERELHVLFNNAGVGYPEKGSRSKQGYELQLGVNVLGTFELTKYLTPTLVLTAKRAKSASVRVIWASSSAAEAQGAKGFVEGLADWDKKGAYEQYCLSKLGNYFHATEFAARHRSDGVVSIPLNPGNIDSEFWRTQGPLVTCLLRKTLLHPPVYGAYTNLFAGFSDQVTMDRSGEFVGPWGKFRSVARDMIEGSKTESQGGNGTAQRLWEWSEAQVKPYVN
ncbi:NAD(P)-binding protein [Xylaria sp. CBS 124048]|nr:NAD(P)-binding protein [Xylaria sp. CBS 124048]